MTDFALDCRGLLCPLPVIRTQDKIKNLTDGDELEVICSDPGALHDIPAWCRVNGHEIIGTEQNNNEIFIQIRVCTI